MLRSERSRQPECSGSAIEIELLKAAIRDKEKIIEGLEENQRLLREKIEFLEAKAARSELADGIAAAGWAAAGVWLYLCISRGIKFGKIRIFSDILAQIIDF